MINYCQSNANPTQITCLCYNKNDKTVANAVSDHLIIWSVGLVPDKFLSQVCLGIT